MCVFLLAIIIADVCWHVWEYKERKRLDDCWNDLFNCKLDSDRRYIDLMQKIISNQGANDDSGI